MKPQPRIVVLLTLLHILNYLECISHLISLSPIMYPKTCWYVIKLPGFSLLSVCQTDIHYRSDTHVKMRFIQYTCQVWHFPITNHLRDQIEQIQLRALKIIFPNYSYQESLVTANLITLFERRESYTMHYTNLLLDLPTS